MYWSSINWAIVWSKTNKMPQGHRGANHPVKNLSKNKVEITSQNHGYQIDLDSLPNCLEVTHTSLFDNSIEGIRHRSLPIFQFSTIQKLLLDQPSHLTCSMNF